MHSPTRPDVATRPVRPAGGRRLKALATGTSVIVLAAALAACGGRPSPVFSSATYAGNIEPTVSTPEVRDRPAEAARRAEEERQAILEAQREADEAAEAVAAQQQDGGGLDVAAVPPEPVDAAPLAPEPPAAAAAAPPSTVPGTPPTARPEPVTEPAATPEPTPEPEPAPRRIVEPQPEPEPVPAPVPEPAPAQQAAEAPRAEPMPEPAPSAEEPSLSFGSAPEPEPEAAASDEPAAAEGSDVADGGAALSFGGRERPPRPAVSDEYPSLSSVPERPTDLPTSAERDEIRRELEAGRSEAQAIAETGERPTETGEGTPAIPEAPPERVEVTEPTGTPEVAEAPATAAPAGRELLGTVSFPPGATDVPSSEASGLRDLASQLAGREGAIRIVGHASAGTGGDATSRRVAANGIALDRANAVANALIAAGVDSGRISVLSAPIDPDATTSDPESRKADIFIVNN